MSPLVKSTHLCSMRFDCGVILMGFTNRIRWYGGRLATDKSILPVPDGDAVFVERKTHHECWVPEQSTKERFPFRSGNVQNIGWMHTTFKKSSVRVVSC